MLGVGGDVGYGGCEPIFFGGGGGGRVGGGVGVGLGGQSGCERRIEVFVKIQKKKFWGGGGQGGCERNVGGRG